MPLFEPVLPDPDVVGRLEEVCGPRWVSVGMADRIAYARDMWPRSLIRQRGGSIDSPPDVVVWPADAEQVAAVVRVASTAGLPVVPFGAGSGVCAGTLPLRGGVVLDLKRMNRVVEVLEQDCLLRVEAGVVGENLERELNRRGWTLGHFPSSMYCSTVGGWIAARGAGQCSSRYGKIEDLVRSLTWVDAAGEVHQTPRLEPAATGWFLDPLLIGSEGTLGVVVEAELVLRPLASERWYRGYRFADIEEGLAAMRRIMRAGLRPTVLRLYDEFDTVIAHTGPEQEEVQESLLKNVGRRVSGPFRSLLQTSLRRLLMTPRLLNRLVDMLPGGCLLVVVQEGGEDERRVSAEGIGAICRGLRAADLGEGPGRHWWTNRYSISYKQSPLFCAGAFVDTMEVATTWDRLVPLYRAVRRAVAPHAFIMAHFSHAYREGCSVYFTFAAAASDDAAAAASYDRIWDAAQGAVLAQGGVVSHHHGVGMSKQRFLVQQLGEAVVLASAVKKAFDPRGLFNPGKLGTGMMREESS